MFTTHTIAKPVMNPATMTTEIPSGDCSRKCLPPKMRQRKKYVSRKDDKYEPVAVGEWHKIYAPCGVSAPGSPVMTMQANTHYIKEKSDKRDKTYSSWARGKMQRLVLVCPRVTVAANSGGTL